MARSSDGKGKTQPTVSAANALPELLIILTNSACFKQYSEYGAEELRSMTVSSPTSTLEKFQFEPTAVDEEIYGVFGGEFDRAIDASREQFTWILSDQIGTLWGAT